MRRSQVKVSKVLLCGRQALGAQRPLSIFLGIKAAHRLVGLTGLHFDGVRPVKEVGDIHLRPTSARDGGVIDNGALPAADLRQWPR